CDPARTARAFAIIHGAIYHVRYGNQAETEINMGLIVGELAASFILKSRETDGSMINENYIPTLTPGYHQMDPINPIQGFSDPHWGKVKPFFLDFASKFRAPNAVGEIIWIKNKHSTYQRSNPFWRPIIGIRDPQWVPLGAPSFPASVSGHATFGSATFEASRRFYDRDNISFQFQSDEYNGKTIDSNSGRPRPALFRSYASLSAAEQENADSRIYLGVHWRSDALRGQEIGRQVAFEVFRK
ncbi:unnamed protein product, partial [Rotaria socialis]